MIYKKIDLNNFRGIRIVEDSSLNSMSDSYFENSLILLPKGKIQIYLNFENYDIKTEIYFVGKMFEDLINRLKLSNFNFSSILDLMILHLNDERISSFKEIKEKLKIH